MSTNHKEFRLPKSLLQLVTLGLFCLGAGIVVGQSDRDRSANVLLKQRETVNSIPKEYGRLVTVERRSDGTVLYFEAPDGTIRFVTVVPGVDYGSLRFKAVTVPRN